MLRDRVIDEYIAKNVSESLRLNLARTSILIAGNQEASSSKHYMSVASKADANLRTSPLSSRTC